MIKALDTQVGGGHYKSLAIQPIEYTFHNKLNYLQGNIVKYITRYKDKNGKEDLEKVIHYAQLLIDFEYGDTPYDALSELGRDGPRPPDRDPTKRETQRETLRQEQDYVGKRDPECPRPLG